MIVLIHALNFLLFSLVTANELILPSVNNEKFKILSQFPDHMLLLHFDNASYYDLDLFFDPAHSPKFINLFNYDTCDDLMERPSGYKFINIVFLRKWRAFVKFSIVQRNIKYEDIIIYVTRNFVPFYDEKFHYIGTENANVVFIYVVNDNTMFFTHFFNNAEGLLEAVEVDSNGIPKLKDQQNSFKNFRRFQMKVAFSTCEPFVYSRKKGDVIELKGVELAVLKIIAGMLNFSIELIDFSNKTLPRTSMVQAVHDKEVHVAIGCLSNTISRNQLVDFTSEVRMEIHTAIFSNRGFKNESFFKIFKPFHGDVWVYLFVAIILMGFLIKNCLKIMGIKMEYDIIDFIKIPYTSIVEQPIKLPSNKTLIRIIIISWLLVALIISNSYKSKLASSFIQPLTREPENLGQLISNNFKFEIPSNDPTFLKETLSHSNEENFKEVLKRWNVGTGFCEAVKKTLTGKFAIIDEITSIKYLLWNKCAKILTPQEINSIRLIRHKILPNSHVWAIQQSAPFIKRFTMALEILQSTGIIEKWYKSYNLTGMIPLSNERIKQDKASPLNLKLVLAPFVLLIIGSLVATFVFIIEILRTYKQIYI